MAAASGFEQRRPQQPAGMGRGALFALLVHGGLLIALAFGVNWRSSEPAGTSAELWSAVPQVAAPAAVTPPPAPPPPEPKPEPKPEVKAEPPPPPPKPDTREADIALEKAKAAEKEKREREEREKAEKLAREKERAEREKAEREKQAKAEKDKREREERERREAEQQAKAREDYLKRIQGQAGATGAPQSTGTATRDAGPSAGYAGKIIARVRPNIVLTDSVPPTVRAVVEVRAAPDGTITARRLVRPSGNPSWDEAVLRAIDRTETLPKDDNGRVPPSIEIGFTPA